MSTQGANATTVILGLKRYFGVESDEALSAKLAVAKSTIATWRRRNSIPTKTLRELETRHGITSDYLSDQRSDIMRDYVLRQAYYIVVLGLFRATVEAHIPESEDAEFADNIAIIEPYLRRVIVRAASIDKYQGVAGAASFLLDLRANKLDSQLWVAEAQAERRRELPRKVRDELTPTNTPTN